MNITEVRIDPLENPRGKLRAFGSVTFDDLFVVKNFKVIDGDRGLFVAMPSRKLTKPCYECDNRVFRNANYCDNCGYKFQGNSGQGDEFKNKKFHADIAFPIKDGFKQTLEERILTEFRSITGQGMGGSPEELHQEDENYDLLDFDFGSEDGNGNENGDESTDVPEDTSSEEPETEEPPEPKTPLDLDVFSNPGAPLSASAKSATTARTVRTAGAGAGNEENGDASEGASENAGTEYY